MDKYGAAVFFALLVFAFAIGLITGVRSEQLSAHESADGIVRMECPCD